MIVTIKMNVALHMVLMNLEKIVFFRVIKLKCVKVFRKILFVILEQDAHISITSSK